MASSKKKSAVKADRKDKDETKSAAKAAEASENKTEDTKAKKPKKAKKTGEGKKAKADKKAKGKAATSPREAKRDDAAATSAQADVDASWADVEAARVQVKEARSEADTAREQAAAAQTACDEATAELVKAREEASQARAEAESARADAEAAAVRVTQLSAEATAATELAEQIRGTSFSEVLRARPGFTLADLDPRSTPGYQGDKASGTDDLAGTAEEIDALQERLYAEARGGGSRSLLLVVQGMDTAGKGGIMRHVVGLMDPQGVDITAFKQPTQVERSHPFLWRIRRALPRPGQVMVFDRSHYEDVLVVRVHNMVPASTWGRRYGQINTFEESNAGRGITQIKVMLHISNEEQKQRLAERLERPDKHWKYNPGDVDERALWEDYQVAYQAMLDKTSTDVAPWYVVPADRKWYARLAVQQLVVEHLWAMNPQWPAADFDVEAEKNRLAHS